MKTSNKILLGLLAVVFTVPFLLASSLRSKMKKGEYTVEKFENPGSKENMRSGTFTAFKVVKVVAPAPDLLTCHLKQSANMNYSYYNDNSKDSIMVFTSNDTLYIQYLSEKSKTTQDQRRVYHHFEINVDLPAFTNLVVDGAVVVLDSASSANLSVSLKNNGEIKDGSEKRAEESAKVSPGVGRRKEEVLQVSETLKGETRNDADKVKPNAIQNASLEILSLDIKDVLMYRLFYRI